MGIYKSKKNFGWGKSIRFAAKNALRELYGHGHFSTVSTHIERWNQFVKFLHKNGIKDANKCELNHIEAYARQLKGLVDNRKMKPAYAQNLISTVNTVFDAFGADKAMRISPSSWIGKRNTVRQTPPQTDGQVISQAKECLRKLNHSRVVCLFELIRELGLRSKEASLLDCKLALKEAKTLKSIAVVKGTKGGRKRYIPVLKETQLDALQHAAYFQQHEKNLIPSGQSWYQWKNGELRQGRELLKTNSIRGFHDQRAAYACLRYEDITGNLAPVISKKIEDKTTDKQAREIIAQELGHNRTDVISAYIGGIREYC